MPTPVARRFRLLRSSPLFSPALFSAVAAFSTVTRLRSSLLCSLALVVAFDPLSNASAAVSLAASLALATAIILGGMSCTGQICHTFLYSHLTLSDVVRSTFGDARHASTETPAYMHPVLRRSLTDTTSKAQSVLADEDRRKLSAFSAQMLHNLNAVRRNRSTTGCNTHIFGSCTWKFMVGTTKVGTGKNRSDEELVLVFKPLVLPSLNPVREGKSQ